MSKYMYTVYVLQYTTAVETAIWLVLKFGWSDTIWLCYGRKISTEFCLPYCLITYHCYIEKRSYRRKPLKAEVLCHGPTDW